MTPVRTERPWLALGLVALAVGLTANAVLGPLVLDVADDGFPRTVRNQAVGLEAVTLALVVPWCLLVARAARRGRPAAPVLAVAPAGYAAYMLAQYVVGHGSTVPRIALLQVPLLALAVAVVSQAVHAFGDGPVTAVPERQRRRLALVLVGIAAFVCVRYVPLAAAAVSGSALPAEGAEAPAMTWAIVALDLGAVVPLLLSSAAGLRAARPTAVNGAYALLGWFALVPVSVAAMGLAMLLRDDPHASAGGTAFLGVAAAVFTTYAAGALLPVARDSAPARFAVTNRVVNPLLVPLLRSPVGRLLGRHLAVVAYTGRRSGRPHQLVCHVTEDAEDLLVVVGRAADKQWWRNFRAPATVQVWLGGRRVAGTARAELNDSGTVVRVRPVTGS